MTRGFARENVSAMAASRTGPLRDVSVLDLTQALAGPFCTMLLADLGADVVKVEPPSGDMARRQIPFPEDREGCDFGGYFASINRNKRSMVLDLKSTDGKATLVRLAASFDVVVENFRSGVMERLGIGYETLREANPRLVYAAIRGFGDPRTGKSPYDAWPAFDVVAQAMGGVVGMTGPAGTTGSRCGASVGDLFPGALCALGISAAVHAARTSGVGQFLDVAMYDGVLALCENLVYRYSYRGDVLEPAGSGHPALCPFDVYETSDGGCAIAAPSDGQWQRLCELIDRRDLIDDERSRNNLLRVKNRGFVGEQIGAWTRARTTAEVVEALAVEVPVGPVNHAPEIFADAHMKARGMLVEVPLPGNNEAAVFAGPAIKMTSTPPGIYRRAPLLGEHTAEVLRELAECEAGGRELDGHHDVG